MRASPSRIAAFALALFVLACGAADEVAAPLAPLVEERMDVLLPGLIDAIQAKQPVFVMDHVSTDFKDDRGLDYFGVRSLVETWAFRDDEVGARLESVAITPVEDGRLHVAARVSFAVGQRLVEGAPLPPGAVTYALDLVFAREGARWQAVGGSYRRE
ncbi:MAG: hypothetical protein WEF50_00910 [Myxococcota bacterium]